MSRRTAAATVSGLCLALLTGAVAPVNAQPQAPPAPQETRAAQADQAPAEPMSPAEARRAGRETATQPRPLGVDSAAQSAAVPRSAGTTFVPMSPVRVLDTRAAIGVPTTTPVGPDGIVSLNLAGRLPVEATSVVLNLTGTGSTAGTFVSAYPGGSSRPEVSNLNLTPGATRSNAVTVVIGPGGVVDLYHFRGNTHLIADLAGYYRPGDGGSLFSAQAPRRVLDTRDGTGRGGARTPVGPTGTITLDLSQAVPATATAVTMNLTAVDATIDTFITAWPAGSARPNASSVNLAARSVTPNLVTVALGANRQVNLYNHNGSAHLIADIAGHYDPTSGAAYFHLSPTRLLDTRSDGGGPLGADEYFGMPLSPWVPNGATAAVFNLTGTEPTNPTFVTAWPDNQDLPNASNLNLAARQTAPNLATVALTPERTVGLYNRYGSVHLLLDLAGYFAHRSFCQNRCPVSWGDNTFGQLGRGTSGDVTNQPGPFAGLGGALAFAANELNSYAVLDDGSVWASGHNGLGGIGDGELYGVHATPTRVYGLSHHITSIAAGGATAYARATDGRVYAWGWNNNGQVGNGSTAEVVGTPVPVANLTGVVDIAAGYSTAYALKSDGTVWAWGYNGGALGNGSYGVGCDTDPAGSGCIARTPVQVPGLTGVVSIGAAWSNGYAVKSDGTVWAWGWNTEGELGNGTEGSPHCFDDWTGPNCVAVSPVQVTGMPAVQEVVGGATTAYALTTNGDVFAWGWNAQGQVGNGTTGTECAGSGVNCVIPSPTQVSGLTGVFKIAAGTLFAMAAQSNGVGVWAWGSNSYGQLASDGPSDVPIRVAGVQSTTIIGAGGFSAFAAISP